VGKERGQKPKAPRIFKGDGDKRETQGKKSNRKQKRHEVGLRIRTPSKETKL